MKNHKEKQQKQNIFCPFILNFGKLNQNQCNKMLKLQIIRPKPYDEKKNTMHTHAYAYTTHTHTPSQTHTRTHIPTHTNIRTTHTQKENIKNG